MTKTLIQSLLIGVLLLAGCGGADGPTGSGGLLREQFIELYVALRNAQQTARSDIEFETMKNQIFERAGVSPESLTRFAAEHGGQITYMATIWDSIKVRLDLASGVTSPR